MDWKGIIYSYLGIAGSTVQDIPGTTNTNPTLLRRLRCDAQGFLQVLMAPGGLFDVNLVQVAGAPVAATSVAGSVPVEGVDLVGFNPNGNPLVVAGINPNTNVTRILTDMLGNLKVVGTQAANTAADDGTWPVKVASVVKAVLTALVDGDVSNLYSDIYGRLYTHEAAYDSLLDAQKVANTNTDATERDESAQEIANAAPAAQAYFPSAAGIEIGNRSFLSWVMGLRDGECAFEVSNDGTNWVDVTMSPVDAATGSNGYDATHYAEPDVATVYFAVDWERCGYRYIRWNWTPNNATSVFTCYLIQRAL